jgi:hypothetical protein
MIRAPGLAASFTAQAVTCRQVVEAGTQKPFESDPEAQILLLGDSFARIYEHDEPGSAGLIAHLARELKQPLTAIVNDGGASTLVRQELYRKPAALRNKRVVIWEFIERDICFGLEGWQDVPLPPEEP